MPFCEALIKPRNRASAGAISYTRSVFTGPRPPDSLTILRREQPMGGSHRSWRSRYSCASGLHLFRGSIHYTFFSVVEVQVRKIGPLHRIRGADTRLPVYGAQGEGLTVL